MEILKKHFAAASFLLLGLSTMAQTDNASLKKVFKENYTQEYNKAYSEAITGLTKVYDENSYEINLRLGWLHYQNKKFQS